MTQPPHLAWVFLDALKDLVEELDTREYKSKYALATYVSNMFFNSRKNMSKLLDETYEIIEYNDYCWSTTYKTLLDINYVFADKEWQNSFEYLKKEGIIEEMRASPNEVLATQERNKPFLYRFNYENYSFIYNSIQKTLTISTYITVKDIKYISPQNQEIILNNIRKIRFYPPFLQTFLCVILNNLSNEYDDFKRAIVETF
jgi:hypothetical protein